MLNYKGLEAVYEHMTVTDEQVDRQIDRLIDQNQMSATVADRPSQLGDEVVLDYTGFCDGVPFEGGSAKEYPLILGSGQFIPGFEDQLIGKATGEHVDVQVTFPASYPAENLAGKDATFRCRIIEIHEFVRHKADDAFAKAVGGCETFAEFRQQLHDSMQAFIDRQSELELKDRLLSMLCEGYDCEITDDQLEKAVDIEMRELEAQLAEKRLSMELYCQFMSTTEAQLREEFIPAARNNVKRQLIIAEIARLEGLEADEESVAAAFSDLCRQYNVSPEQMQLAYDEQLQSILVRTVIENKVMEVIKANAKITTVEK